MDLDIVGGLQARRPPIDACATTEGVAAVALTGWPKRRPCDGPSHRAVALFTPVLAACHLAHVI
jgi:hypothetical protein